MCARVYVGTQQAARRWRGCQAKRQHGRMTSAAPSRDTWYRTAAPVHVLPLPLPPPLPLQAEAQRVFDARKRLSHIRQWLGEGHVPEGTQRDVLVRRRGGGRSGGGGGRVVELLGRPLTVLRPYGQGRREPRGLAVHARRKCLTGGAAKGGCG